MIKSFYQFIVESNIEQLRYYAFDWDDNILIMPTKIYMEKYEDGEWVTVPVSTKEFAEVRKKEGWRATEKSFLDFRDFGPRGNKAFIEDTITAIKNKQFGPSWNKFIKCLVDGSLFAIITARGHEPETIRKAVEYIIYNVLTREQRNEMAANLIAFKEFFDKNFDVLNHRYTFKELVDEYLDMCDFVGIASSYFANKYKTISSATDPELAKRKVLEDFINKINRYASGFKGSVKFGFSDDDARNVETIKKYFKEIAPLYKYIRFSIHDTSKGEYKKSQIQVQENMNVYRNRRM